jgi:hypothetical protein
VTRVIPAHNILEIHDCSTPFCANEADGDDGKCYKCRGLKVVGEVIEITDRAIRREAIAVAGLKCKYEGCENTVSSHKGTAGWCSMPQVEHGGKSHRQLMIEEKRKSDPGYAKYGERVAVKPAGQGRIEFEIKPRAKQEDEFWLSAVSDEISNAVVEVRDAEESLEYAKTRLRGILEKALEAVK